MKLAKVSEQRIRTRPPMAKDSLITVSLWTKVDESARDVDFDGVFGVLGTPEMVEDAFAVAACVALKFAALRSTSP